jgi:recombination protein RecR
MEYPSKLVETAVNEISKLPGIGKKSALRLTLHILKQDNRYAESLSQAIVKLRTEINYCKKCHSISDSGLCNICSSPKREASILCVVEDTTDVLAIENTGQYFGHYHILGGVISPLDGIGPSDLNIETLIKRISQDQIEEVILALSPTMEGDTTAFYLSKKLSNFNLNLSTIARGIPIGGELEYADEVTLGRSIQTRIAYK